MERRKAMFADQVKHPLQTDDTTRNNNNNNTLCLSLAEVTACSIGYLRRLLLLLYLYLTDKDSSTGK